MKTNRRIHDSETQNSRNWLFRFLIVLLFLFVPLITGLNLYGQYSINGPTLLCTSGNYTIQNWPSCCATITWSTEGNVQLSSGQGSPTANFNINGNGPGKIKAHMIYCNVDYYLELNIFAGRPLLNYLSPETGEYGYAGNQYSFAAWPYYELAEGVATWYHGAQEVYNWQNYVQIYFESAGSYYISAEVSNSCGSSGEVTLEPYYPWIVY